MSNQLPSLDLYNGAVQNPRSVFTDPSLQKGTVLSNGMGLPIPFSGGFALTYKFTCGPKHYAVRVFHKRSDHLEDRYAHIGAALQRLNSPYFIEFAYQQKGILIGGQPFPIVKMDWVEGDTLGDFLDLHYSNSSQIATLRSNFQKVGALLAANGLAHGDLQTGNIMVGASSFKLIDYDGMYVGGMTEIRSAEIGHRHFQHPGRTETAFNSTIDRFSLILIDFSLELIQAKSALFKKYGNTGENILFTATDFRDPACSPLFQELYSDPIFKDKAARFAALCKSPFSSIPTPEDFASGRWTSTISIKFSPRQSLPAPQTMSYVGAYEVCNAQDFEAVLKQVGNRIELIGRIFEVAEQKTKHGRPYVFINFGLWKGKIVKIAIWSTVLKTLSLKPTAAWKGRWISVTGLVDSPYKSPRHSYIHLSVTLAAGNQLNFLDESTAKYRLRMGSVPATSGNADVIRQLRVTSPRQQPTSSVSKSRNQQVLDTLQRSNRPQQAPVPPSGSKPVPPIPKKSSDSPGCWLYIVIFVIVVILYRACSGR